MAKQNLVPAGKVKLLDFDPNYTGGFTKATARAEESKLEERLAELQERLYAGRQAALLIVLQGMDTAGKDGAIEHVFDVINPNGLRVANFKVPTSEELAHDFLWRIHKEAPEKGYIGIFNRSHYEDVLVVRVNKLVPESVWKARYEQINHFEHILAASGTRILKFYLHISKDEQKERLQARLEDPAKHWKFNVGDLKVREQWDEYMNAYEDALSNCNMPYAPWYIVPANKKWYRNLVITRTIVETLEQMNLQFPQSEDLSGVVIPD
ncbi:MAG: polyphosphate kinase 2 family protein [Anaerolinea sp.]|nr:polyphosphate kinase 2 family protein [Anaerolinea sp.]